MKETTSTYPMVGGWGTLNEVPKKTTPIPLHFSKHSSNLQCHEWPTQIEMLPPSWRRNRRGESATWSRPLLDRSTSAPQTSKAESQGPRSVRAALYLPSHSLIFSSTNSSPFARSWFCQKRTTKHKSWATSQLTTLFHFQQERARSSGRSHARHASKWKKTFVLLEGQLQEKTVRHPIGKEWDKNQTQHSPPSPQPWKRHATSLAEFCGWTLTPNIFQALNLNSEVEALRRWEIIQI